MHWAEKAFGDEQFYVRIQENLPQNLASQRLKGPYINFEHFGIIRFCVVLRTLV